LYHFSVWPLGIILKVLSELSTTKYLFQCLKQKMWPINIDGSPAANSRWRKANHLIAGKKIAAMRPIAAEQRASFQQEMCENHGLNGLSGITYVFVACTPGIFIKHICLSYDVGSVFTIKRRSSFYIFTFKNEMSTLQC
jgi:hypothetical protein